MKLKNIKNAVVEITNILSHNEPIIRLVVNDSPDAAEIPVSMTTEELVNEKYLCFEFENAIELKNRNTFISTVVDEIFFNNTDANISARLNIYISTDTSHLIIKDNKNRALELLDLITSLLDNYKLSSAGQISIDYANRVNYNNYRLGYVIGLTITDQQVRKAEI